VVVASVWSVKQVVKVRTLPAAAEADALEQALRVCNAATTWLSQQMHAARVFYGSGRAWGAAAIRVIGKVYDAYTSLHPNIAAGNHGPPGTERRRRVEDSPIAFRPLAAQPFDARCLSWQFQHEMGRAAAVSIWTLPAG
jgi:putative transposase